MIVGVGTDLVERVRIEKSYKRYGNRFAVKILGSTELQDFSRVKFKAAFLAKRFAAKEAVAKALGTGMRDGVHFSGIEVTHDHRGQPGVYLSGGAAYRADELGIKQWHLSLSDERQHALAFAIAEK